MIKKIIFRLMRALVLAYMLGGILLYFFQRDLLFHPTAKVAHSYAFEQIPSEDALLDVIVLHPNQQQALLYFGGNAESVAETADYFQRLLPEYTVYLVNYRAYGGSTGEPSEQALFADSLFVYDKVVSRHQAVSVIGRSLGTGVASYLVTQRAVDKLVLITPYDSISSVAQARYPFYPINFMLHDKFDTLSYAAQIKVDTLVFKSESDRVVPHQHTDTLLAALPHAKLTTIVGSEHGDIVEFDALYTDIAAFLASK